jgi:hypothetical protein
MAGVLTSCFEKNKILKKKNYVALTPKRTFHPFPFNSSINPRIESVPSLLVAPTGFSPPFSSCHPFLQAQFPT